MPEENNNLLPSSDPSPDKEKEKEERRKDLKQFEGVKSVTKKEDNWFITLLRRIFFSGRTTKEIAMDITENNIIPWFQDGAYNLITIVASNFIYRGGKSSPGPASTNSSGNFVNYVSFSDKKKQENKSALESNKNKDAVDIMSGFEYPAFENDPPGTKRGRTALQKAMEFLQTMHDYVRKYHSLSVEDLGWMRGKVVNYAWDAYGWTEEEILAIREPTHINNPKTPYVIMMPKAHEDYDKA